MKASSTCTSNGTGASTGGSVTTSGDDHAIPFKHSDYVTSGGDQVAQVTPGGPGDEAGSEPSFTESSLDVSIQNLPDIPTPEESAAKWWREAQEEVRRREPKHKKNNKENGRFLFLSESSSQKKRIF